MTGQPQDDDLEGLLESAHIEHGNTLRNKRALRSRGDVDANYRQSFTRPENWQLVAQTRLIHMDRDTDAATLVGLFDEYHHKSVRTARRLVAASEERADLPHKSEEVYGREWLPDIVMERKALETERTVEVVAPVTLDMGQALMNDACLLSACLVGGGLQKLTLVEEARFVGHTPRTVLCLPARLDILEAMTRSSKEIVWRLIGEALGTA